MQRTHVGQQTLSKANQPDSGMGRLGEVALVAAVVITPWGSQTLNAAVSVVVLLGLIVVVQRPLRVPAAPLLIVMLLVIAGALGLALTQPNTTDLVRDLFYLFKLGVFLAIGMVSALDLFKLGVFLAIGMVSALDPINRPRVLRALVWGGAIEACYHLAAVASSPTAFQGSLEALRLETGRGTLIEPIALLILILWRANRIDTGVNFRPFIYWLLTFLIGTSTALYFSRTLLLALALGLATSVLVNAWHVASGRRLPGRFGVVGPAIASMTLAGTTLGLLSQVQSGPLADLVDKARNSLNEILPANATSQVEITQGYRSYESYRAIAAYAQGSPPELIHGRGWGYAVNLGIDTASSTADFERITASVLHNGYLSLLVKSGPVGIALYLLLLFIALQAALRLTKNHGANRLLGEVAASSAILVAVTTTVIAGLLSGSMFNPIALLLGAALAGGKRGRNLGSGLETKLRVSRTPQVV